MPSTTPRTDLSAAAGAAIVDMLADAVARAVVARQSCTRAGVLVALREAGRPMTTPELAEVMQADPRTVGNILGRLFFRNLIERRRLPGAKVAFEYRAYEVRA